MRLTRFDIPDDLWEKFDRGGLGLTKDAILQFLKDFQGVQPYEKCILIKPAQVAELQALTDVVLASGEDVVRAFQDAKRISVEGVNVKLEPTLLEQMKLEAEFNERPMDEYIGEQLQYALAAVRGF
jgi:hypothetical protein